MSILVLHDFLAAFSSTSHGPAGNDRDDDMVVLPDLLVAVGIDRGGEAITTACHLQNVSGVESNPLCLTFA